MVGQAKVAFEASDFAKFESLLLRAQRPELAVKQYRDAGMWPEALRLCKEYLPNKLRALQVRLVLMLVDIQFQNHIEVLEELDNFYQKIDLGVVKISALSSINQ